MYINYVGAKENMEKVLIRINHRQTNTDFESRETMREVRVTVSKHYPYRDTLLKLVNSIT